MNKTALIVIAKNIANYICAASGFFALLLWATTAGLTKSLLSSGNIGPLRLTAISTLVAGIVLLVLTTWPIKSREPMSRFPSWRQWRMAGLPFILYFVLFNLALYHAPTGHATQVLVLVNYLWLPIMVILVKRYLRWKYHVKSALQFGGVVLSVVGLVIAMLGKILLESAETIIWSNLSLQMVIMFLAACSWAWYSTYMEMRQRKVVGDGVQWFFLLLGIGMGALVFASNMVPDEPFNWDKINKYELVYLSVGPTAIGYYLWPKGLQSGDPSILKSVALLLPIASIAFMAFYLGECMTSAVIVGALFVAAGAALAKKGMIKYRETT